MIAHPGKLASLSGLAVLCASTLLACGTPAGRGPAAVVRTPGPAGARLSAVTATATARAFLARYVAADGRVVRRDQGGDSVSEGQAYALLISVAIGDRAHFLRVWQWTRRHLQRRDGLLAWHWAAGHVVGAAPASDADLDAAHALIVAGRRFGDRRLLAAGRHIGAAILAHETRVTAIGPVLVAGPWARSTGVIDPSYFSPAAFQTLFLATGDRRWVTLEQSSETIVAALTDHAGERRLAPDWARISAAGTATPSAAPSGASPRFSYDALRLPVRMLAAGSATGRTLAARSWRFFAGAGGTGPAASAYTLAGRPLVHARVPALMAAAAAAAGAAGDQRAAALLLARAGASNAQAPTYYGTAMLALTELTLTQSALPGLM